MADITKTVDLVNAIDASEMDAFIALFMYQGFNPEMVMRHLAQVRHEHNIPDHEFKKDIKTIISMGVIMGNYNKNNSSKISDEGKTEGDRLITKYKIKSGGVGREKKSVTIPRILATFPIIASRLQEHCPVRDYGGELSANFLPRCMKVSVFPSLVPRGLQQEVKVCLLACFTCYSTEQTLAISKRTDVQKAFNDQKKYTDISYSSMVPTDAEREKHFSKLTFDHQALEKVAAAAEKALSIKITVPSTEVFRAAKVTIK